MSDQQFWILGAFAFVAALAAALSGERVVLVVTGALAVVLFWGGWRYGKRR